MSKRLRLLRKRQGITLEALAEAAGLTKSYLSKVERGLSQPSIAAALKLATALGVKVETLFSDDSSPEAPYSLVRADTRRSFGAKDDGFAYSPLTERGGLERILPFVLYPNPDFADRPHMEHGGEEFLFVHHGSIEIDLGSEHITLGPGDSLHFSGGIPHRIRGVGPNRAEVLIVVVADQ